MISLTLNLSLTQTMFLFLAGSLVVAWQFESGDDVHGLQLLEQQFAGIRDTQGGNMAGRLTVVAPKRKGRRIRLDTHQDSITVFLSDLRTCTGLMLSKNDPVLCSVINPCRISPTCFSMPHFCNLLYLSTLYTQYLLHVFPLLFSLKF